MFNWKKTNDPSTLDVNITQIELVMETMTGDPDEYHKMLGSLERLYKLKEKHSPKQINPDTLLIVGGNLLGILAILWHEQAHVITSRAIGFAGKLR